MKSTFKLDYFTGSKLDELREGHPLFIEECLRFGADLKVSRNHGVSRRYGEWLGVTNWSSHDVHNLFVLLSLKYGVTITATQLHGVTLRDE